MSARWFLCIDALNLNALHCMRKLYPTLMRGVLLRRTREMVVVSLLDGVPGVPFLLSPMALSKRYVSILIRAS